MEWVLAVLLIFGGVSAAKKEKSEVVMAIPSCQSDLRFAERDLSGATAFEAGQMIYRDEAGQLCKG